MLEGTIEGYNKPDEVKDELNKLLALWAKGDAEGLEKLLSENKVYTEIVEKTGASSATVSRVKRAMEIDREYFDKLLGTLDGKL